MTIARSTKKTDSTSIYVGEIGERKATFNLNSNETIDWTEVFARLIVGDDVEDFVARNGLLQETKSTVSGGVNIKASEYVGTARG